MIRIYSGMLQLMGVIFLSFFFGGEVTTKIDVPTEINAGKDIKVQVTINKGDFNRLIEIKPDMSSGGVAFYDGVSSSPADVEARRWIDAVKNDTAPVVLPEQACVVSEILEAIYKSAATGQPVYFD
jgi:predicted dehydrogenase